MGVPSPRITQFVELGESLDRVRACRFQQSIARWVACFDLDKRVVDKRAQCIDHTPRTCGEVGGNRLRQLEVESTDEHAEEAKDELLLLGEQPIAPVDGAEQRLMSRCRGSRAAGQQLQALVETALQTVDSQQAHASGRE